MDLGYMSTFSHVKAFRPIAMRKRRYLTDFKQRYFAIDIVFFEKQTERRSLWETSFASCICRGSIDQRVYT